jgi:hypothetical protein
VKVIDQDARDAIKELGQLQRVCAQVLARCENRPETNELFDRVLRTVGIIEQKLGDK